MHWNTRFLRLKALFCLLDVNYDDCSNRGDHLVKRMLPLLPRLTAQRTDLLLVNFALWFNEKDTYRAHLKIFEDYYITHKASRNRSSAASFTSNNGQYSAAV